MFKSVRIIGHGRVGSALAARLQRTGMAVDGPPPDLVLLCVPDRAIAEVAAGVSVGPWIAHVSGAAHLSALDPHQRRFTLHPLQTFNQSGAASQLDGAWAALSAESDEALIRAHWLASALDLHAFEMADDARVLYHAGAAIASNYLVTLYRAASALFECAGAPPEALLPLMRRTIDNGFELTGPIARGDWSTVDAHLAAIRVSMPRLAAMYEALAEATAP
jgi:predicted short-subunit dehydrogenase-like oxidoreductase (DUF2520 family)